MPKKTSSPAQKDNQLSSISSDTLSFNDAPRIAWILVQDAVKLLSPHNPKLHDMGSIIQSIDRYGFQELPKYDETVNWIKAGNGRIEALVAMEKEVIRLEGEESKHVYNLPRGLALDDKGQWAMPLLIGTNAVNENEALAYLVDANNLTMLGGDYTPYEISKMWDVTKYNELLQGLAQTNTFSVSMDADDVRIMDAALQGLLIALPEVKHEGGNARRTKITLVLEESENNRLEEIVENVKKFLDTSGYKVGVDV